MTKKTLGRRPQPQPTKKANFGTNKGNPKPAKPTSVPRISTPVPPPPTPAKPKE